MDRRVAELNIEHFEKLLVGEPDSERRKMIVGLLGEEKAKLKLIKSREREQNGSSRASGASD